MKFSKEQRDRLKKNPNVKEVYPTCIRYCKEFKEKAIYEYDLGKNPKNIFIDAGFAIEDLSDNRDYPAKTINQWLAAKKINIHYPTEIKKRKFADKNEEFLLAKIAYLEEENKLLKKLKRIEN